MRSVVGLGSPSFPPANWAVAHWPRFFEVTGPNRTDHRFEAVTLKFRNPNSVGRWSYRSRFSSLRRERSGIRCRNGLACRSSEVVHGCWGLREKYVAEILLEVVDRSCCLLTPLLREGFHQLKGRSGKQSLNSRLSLMGDEQEKAWSLIPFQISKDREELIYIWLVLINN